MFFDNQRYFKFKHHDIFSLNQLMFSSSSRSQWPRGLRRRSAAARLLRMWVRIPPAAWMCVCCECCVLSGRGLCDELITRPEESYRLWYFVECDLETLRMRRPYPALGRSAKGKDLVTVSYMFQPHVVIIRMATRQTISTQLFKILCGT